jgi:hypothetical protein
VKIQALIPQPTNSGTTNNYLPVWPSQRVTSIPAVKIDQQLGPRSKLSFYWSLTRTDSDYAPTSGLADGLPDPITQAVGTHIHSQIESLNYNFSLTPTLLLHLSAGLQQKASNGTTKVNDYNAEKELGLKGATVIRSFPRFTGLNAALGGGMVNMGQLDTNISNTVKPSGNASLTWVHNNQRRPLRRSRPPRETPPVAHAGLGGRWAHRRQSRSAVHPVSLCSLVHPFAANTKGKIVNGPKTGLCGPKRRASGFTPRGGRDSHQAAVFCGSPMCATSPLQS